MSILTEIVTILTEAGLHAHKYSTGNDAHFNIDAIVKQKDAVVIKAELNNGSLQIDDYKLIRL